MNCHMYLITLPLQFTYDLIQFLDLFLGCLLIFFQLLNLFLQLHQIICRALFHSLWKWTDAIMQKLQPTSKLPQSHWSTDRHLIKSNLRTCIEPLQQSINPWCSKTHPQSANSKGQTNQTYSLWMRTNRNENHFEMNSMSKLYLKTVQTCADSNTTTTKINFIKHHNLTWNEMCTNVSSTGLLT